MSLYLFLFKYRNIFVLTVSPVSESLFPNDTAVITCMHVSKIVADEQNRY